MNSQSEKIEEIVLKYISEQFGVDRIEFELKEMGKGRVYALKPCSIEVKEHHSGIYIGKFEKDGFRLSIEGSALIGPHARRNVIEVDDEVAAQWMSGKDIPSDVRGYVILKWKNFFLGCGRGNGKFIRNFVPKNRRISNTAKY
ncbi:methyltransferase RsmF C-terminal domain-like protein [Archaeoglobus veneficus]|uniref:rRNA small subunit methyltransferase F RNA-binding PUA-like domain-containing protein n=1 Tax=Archaeoglobus veneficus (strain DSM 11195 / SNP6) TaxID=693661 RepID=F2KS62_ARCVS|nr:hypothetical protein [Archaeoglobus veneficus]AEA48001.1 hypothetical protein Arcve_2008 [Archaeoglobus veneficus SNP6]